VSNRTIPGLDVKRLPEYRPFLVNEYPIDISPDILGSVLTLGGGEERAASHQMQADDPDRSSKVAMGQEFRLPVPTPDSRPERRSRD
jgi:hypothetical protein